MKTLIVCCFVIFGSMCQFSQSAAPIDVKTITLTSPYAEDGHGKLKRSEKTTRNCFDLVSEREVACRGRWDVIYGNIRVGDDWDWFFVSGYGGVRTRIVSLGEKEWTDEPKVPFVEPFQILVLGGQRVTSIDSSGTHAAAGVWGADAPHEPAITGAHYVKVQKGFMYAVHVVDDENDFYVLMRVDDVVRGRTATVSWKQVPAPTEWEEQ